MTMTDRYHAHSTPDPDAIPTREPTPPPPMPDDVPPPANAPVEEPTLPEPPIRTYYARDRFTLPVRFS